MIRSTCISFRYVLKNTCYLSQDFKRYAGHNKWSNIRHIKGAKDQEKSVTFQRVTRMIRLAICAEGSSDPKLNFKLKQALEIAKKENVPSATVNKCLKDAGDSKSKQERIIELQGPSGSVILVALLSDNLNRSRIEIINPALKRANRIAKNAEVSRLDHVFDHKGVIEAVHPNITLEEATNHAIEVDAEDVVEVDKDGRKQLEFFCVPSQVDKISSALRTLGYEILTANSDYIAHTCVNLNEDDMNALRVLYDKLEAHPDVLFIYDNII